MKQVLPHWARSQFTVETITVRDTPVPLITGGTGTPVLLIHGLSGSIDWWQFNAPALAECFRVILVDLPGFGRLGHLDLCDSMSEYGDWVQALIDALGIDKAHLIGHSMGGFISLQVAIQLPERVDRLVLVAPAVLMPSHTLAYYWIPLAKTIREIPPALFPMALRDLRRANARILWRSAHDLIGQDLLEMLGEAESPTLVIWGEEDPILPHHDAHRFVEAMPHARLVTLEGAGHIAMIDEPDRFNRCVLEFLLGSAKP